MKSMLVYTKFSSAKHVLGEVVYSTIDDFIAECAKPYATKEAQPLAVPDLLEGNSRAQGSNSIQALSVFLDYDKPALSMAKACAALRKLGACFVAYHTFSWTAERETYRIVLPLSRPIDLAERRHLIARIDLVLPGVAPESYDNKRGYYVGSNGQGKVLQGKGATADTLKLPDAPKPAQQKSAAGISTKNNPMAKAQELVASLGHKLRNGEGRWSAVEFLATRVSARRYPEDQCYLWLADMITRYFDPQQVTDQNRTQWEKRIAHWLTKDAPKKAAETKPALPTFFAYGELAAMKLPPTEWIVDGLLPPGLALFAGPPKKGKSRIAEQLAEAVSSGNKFLGKATRKGYVVYYNLEVGHKLIQENMEKLNAVSGISPQDCLLHFGLVLEPGKKAVEQIRENMRRNPGIRLVVIDIFARVRDSTGLQAKGVYQFDYDAMAAFQAICDDYPKLCLLVVHHTNKRNKQDLDGAQDAISGSAGLAGGTHTNIVMGSAGKSGASPEDKELMSKFAILNFSGKRVEPRDLVVQHSGRGTWEISDKKPWEISQTNLQQEIMAVIKSDLAKLWSSTEVAQELGKNKNTVKEVMRRMAQRGEITSPSKQGYTLPGNSLAAADAKEREASSIAKANAARSAAAAKRREGQQ